MKFKNGVIVQKDKNDYVIKLENDIIEVLNEDNFIVKALLAGIEKEDELVKLVIKHDKTNQVMANLRMAQFVLDYSDYLSNDIGHMLIEP